MATQPPHPTFISLKRLIRVYLYLYCVFITHSNETDFFPILLVRVSYKRVFPALLRINTSRTIRNKLEREKAKKEESAGGGWRFYFFSVWVYWSGFFGVFEPECVYFGPKVYKYGIDVGNQQGSNRNNGGIAKWQWQQQQQQYHQQQPSSSTNRFHTTATSTASNNTNNNNNTAMATETAAASVAAEEGDFNLSHI